MVNMRYGSPNRTAKGANLLWANEDPTASFTGQTISLNLSQYNIIKIVVRATTDDTINGAVCEIAVDGARYTLLVQNVTTGTRYSYNRGATADNSGVVFTGGYRGATSGNGYCIPIAIYGVR